MPRQYKAVRTGFSAELLWRHLDPVWLRRYEKGSVGGRLKSLHIGDQPYELGGSMVYEGNQYIRYIY